MAGLQLVWLLVFVSAGFDLSLGAGWFSLLRRSFAGTEGRVNSSLQTCACVADKYVQTEAGNTSASEHESKSVQTEPASLRDLLSTRVRRHSHDADDRRSVYHRSSCQVESGSSSGNSIAGPQRTRANERVDQSSFRGDRLIERPVDRSINDLDRSMEGLDRSAEDFARAREPPVASVDDLTSVDHRTRLNKHESVNQQACNGQKVCEGRQTFIVPRNNDSASAAYRKEIQVPGLYGLIVTGTIDSRARLESEQLYEVSVSVTEVKHQPKGEFWSQMQYLKRAYIGIEDGYAFEPLVDAEGHALPLGTVLKFTVNPPAKRWNEFHVLMRSRRRVSYGDGLMLSKSIEPGNVFFLEHLRHGDSSPAVRGELPPWRALARIDVSVQRVDQLH